VALSRSPTKAELAATLRHLGNWKASPPAASRAKGEDAAAAVRREAFEDVLWALLNLKEFVTTH
jgi:hypothetical protein